MQGVAPSVVLVGQEHAVATVVKVWFLPLEFHVHLYLAGLGTFTSQVLHFEELGSACSRKSTAHIESLCSNHL